MREQAKAGKKGKIWALVVAAAFLIGVAAYVETTQEAPQKAAVIGCVRLSVVDDHTLAGLKEALAERGWRLGEDVIISDPGAAGNIGELDAVVAKHLADKVDLIFVSSTPGTQAVQRATRNTGTPVVFTPVNDPVASGIVESLTHPGGNITGVKLPSGDDVRVQWLTRLAPDARHVFAPYTQGDKSAEQSLADLHPASTLLGLTVTAAAVSSTEEAHALAASMPETAQAIFIPRDSGVEAAIDSYVAVAKERKIPISAPSYTQVSAGALYSFGFIHKELGKQGGALVDKILRGAKPSTLPVEVGRSHLTLNLRAAKDIGVTLSDRVIQQATIVVR